MKDQIEENKVIITNPVSIMAELMEARLCEHNHWSGWSPMTKGELAAKILKNLSGILAASKLHGNKEYDIAFEKYIRDQSADIANFAMMIAVNLGKLKEIKMDEHGDITVNEAKCSLSGRNDGNEESIEEQLEEKIDALNEQMVHPESDPETKVTQDTEEANTDGLKKALDLLELKKELREAFGPDAIVRLKRILAEHPEDIDKSWESPLTDISAAKRDRIPGNTTAGADESTAPYENTWTRLEVLEELANDITKRLDPVLAGEGTVAPDVKQDTITQIDAKLASIYSVLNSLYHRIQL